MAAVIRYATILGANYKIIVNKGEFLKIVENVPGGLFSSTKDDNEVLLNIQFKKNFECPGAADVLEHTCKWKSQKNKAFFQHRFFNGQVTKLAGSKVKASFTSKPEKYLFYHIIKLILTSFLPYRSGLLMHASCILINGRSIIFPAPSGHGKTTLAYLWSSMGKATLMNEDTTVLWNTSHSSAEVFPFMFEKLAPNQGLQGRLAAIIFPEGWGENKLHRISGSKAISTLLRNTIKFSFESEAMQAILKLASSIVNEVPCYSLSFVRNESVVNFIDDRLHILCQ